MRNGRLLDGSRQLGRFRRLGSYRLSLLISPPVSARHVEYRDVWLKPHRVTMTFNWKPS